MRWGHLGALGSVSGVCILTPSKCIILERISDPDGVNGRLLAIQCDENPYGASFTGYLIGQVVRPRQIVSSPERGLRTILIVLIPPDP